MNAIISPPETPIVPVVLDSEDHYEIANAAEELATTRANPMELDAKVCYCFHVSRRKLENYVRREKPKVPSQLSLCGGAGTGCGWCIPFLKQIFEHGVDGGATELERLTPQEYEQRRAQYIRAGKGMPPPGAAPLPTESPPE